MKTSWIMMAALAASAFAQQANKPSTDYLGQNWVGLLTSADCRASGSAAKRALDSASDDTTSGRTTTPAVDQSGTRGSSTAGGSPSEAATHDVLPRTGDVHSREKEVVKDAGFTAARKQASSLPSSCGVMSNTREFALLLPDGKAVPFDDVANNSIVKQLQGRSGDSGKGVFLRVRVTGKMQNGRIALDSIRM